jgi:hypothetical protein
MTASNSHQITKSSLREYRVHFDLDLRFRCARPQMRITAPSRGGGYLRRALPPTPSRGQGVGGSTTDENVSADRSPASGLGRQR